MKKILKDIAKIWQYQQRIVNRWKWDTENQSLVMAYNNRDGKRILKLQDRIARRKNEIEMSSLMMDKLDDLEFAAQKRADLLIAMSEGKDVGEWFKYWTRKAAGLEEYIAGLSA